LFFNLPRELRDNIYSFLLPSYTTLKFTKPSWIDHAAGRFFHIQYDMPQCCLTVLAICQQIRAEANALLYGTNHFEFSIGRRGRFAPINTIRALPQSGIGQIKTCTISIFASPGLEKRQLSPIRGWMNEMYQLLKWGGNLQEIEIEVGLDRLDTAGPSDLVMFEALLKPLEGLHGLKSAVVKGPITEAYREELKRVMEGDGARKYKKRKAAPGLEGESVVRLKKKRT
jgi:hypothetical protein